MTPSSNPIAATFFASPVGPLTLVASPQGLRRLHFGAVEVDVPKDAAYPVLADAVRQLDAYFAGSRTAFDLPLDLEGTVFQKQVWTLLQTIPYGTTTTYGALAEQMGDPGRARAVGLANGKNPVGLIVPCHRVVGADGRLTGFAGGLEVKTWLLRHERRHRPAPTTGQAELFTGS